MRKIRQTIIAIALIVCVLCVHAEDSIKVSAADLRSLMQRVERLEQAQAHPNKLGYTDAVSGASQQIPKDTIKPDTIKGERLKVKGERDSVNDQRQRQRRFTIGGYGEVTAKHCFYSNSYLRYGKNPEKYANDHFGEFDLPHVVIYLGYDFGKGWSVGTEIEFEHGGTESAIEIEEEEGGEYESEIERSSGCRRRLTAMPSSVPVCRLFPSAHSTHTTNPPSISGCIATKASSRSYRAHGMKWH